jgi:hypothetical protein
MTARKPLVRVGGKNVQLPAGDTLAGVGDFLKDGSVAMTGALNQAPIRAHNLDSGTGVGGGYIVDADLNLANTLQASGSSDLVGLGSIASGAIRVVIFSGAPIIRYNAAKMQLLTGADIQVRAGDTATFESLGFDAGQTIGNWKMIGYARADGTALVAPAGGTGDFKKDGSVAMTGAFNEAPRLPITIVGGILQASIVAANTFTYGGNPYIDGIDTLPDGVRRVIEFSSTPIMRPSANFILLATGEIQVAAGDRAEFISHGSGVWEMLWYVRANGTALVAPAGGTGDFKKDGSVQMTGAFRQAPSVTVDSTTNVLPVGAAASDNINVTGTSAIDYFDDVAPAGTRVVLTFNSVRTIGDFPPYIDLPGGSITTAVGDTAEFLCTAAQQWKCLWYERANGTALVGSPDNTKLPLIGGQMTGPFNEAYGSAALSGGTLTFGANGNSAFVSANAGDQISAIADPSVTTSGATRRIVFVNAGIILVHGNLFALPTQANITVRLFDSIILQADSAIAWRVISYQRADGSSLVGSPDATKVPLTAVGAANGVAPLGADSKIASAYLPSYVDDVLEFANLAAFPATGETGKIYIAIDTNREYRWSGSVYTAIVASPGTTDNVPEGTTNLYLTAARVLNVALAGLSLATGTAVIATDSILVAVGKLQKQITDLTAVVANKEPTITAGTAAQYWNGSKVFTDFAGSVRSAVLTAISFGTSTPVTATDSVLTAIGKLQAQLTAYGGVFRTETIATSSVGQTSYAVPNGYTVGSIIVFFNGVLQAPADFTATDGANVVLASGSLTTSDIMSVLVIGAVRAQDDALLQYTVATLPAANANLAKLRYCTNMAGGAGPVFSNGTQWLRVADNTVVTT